MLLLKKIKNSIYNPSFYTGVLNAPAGSSFKYFFVLIIYLALFLTIVFSFIAIPVMIRSAKLIITQVTESYPAGLEISFASGTAMINRSGTVAIPFPADNGGILDAIKKQSRLDNLVVIDTLTPFSTEHFFRQKTLLLLSKDSFVSLTTKNGSQTIQISPLEPSLHQTITKNDLVSLSSTLLRLFKYLAPLLVLMIFLLSFIVYASLLLPLFIVAFGIWIIYLARRERIGFWKAYQLGLHASTLYIIMATIGAFIFSPHLLSPFYFIVVSLVMLLINVFSVRPPRESASEVAN